MAKAKRFRDMTDDEVFERWVKRLGKIRRELKYLFASRRKFRVVTTMFEENAALNAIGGNVHGWLLEMWIHDTVIGIRRELDHESNAASFGVLLDEIVQRPSVLTRRRFTQGLDDTDFMLPVLTEIFDGYGVIKVGTDRQDDYLDPLNVRAERQQLDDTADKVLAFANRVVAHRNFEYKVTATYKDLNDALDSIEPVFKKYFAIIDGRSVDTHDPPLDADWTKPFETAWLVSPTERH